MSNFVKLPPSQKKILASLDFLDTNDKDDLPALKLQKKIVGDLFNLYSIGHDSEEFTAPVSDSKALTYQERFIAINNKIQQLASQVGAPADADLASDKHIINYDFEKKSSRSDYIFKKMSWFHALRLFSVRGKNLGEKIYTFVTQTIPDYLPYAASKTISALGAFYGINTLIDIGTLAYIVFRPRREGELDLPYWQRLKDAMTKERRSRMFNDILWTTTNILGMVLTGGGSILITLGIITVGSFFLDVVNETTLAGVGWHDHKQLLKTGAACKADDELPQNAIDHINAKVNKKSKDARFNTIRAALTFTLIAIAAIPGAFPIFKFVKQPIVSLISSATAFVFGSLFAGLGRKFLLKYREKKAEDKKARALAAQKKSKTTETNPNLSIPTPNNAALENQATVEPIVKPVVATVEPIAVTVPPALEAQSSAATQASIDNPLTDTVIESPRTPKTLFTEAHLIQSMSKQSRRASQIEALDLAIPNIQLSNSSRTLTRNPSTIVFPNFTFPPRPLPKAHSSPTNNLSVKEIDQELNPSDIDDQITTADVLIEPADSFSNTSVFYGRLWHHAGTPNKLSAMSTPQEVASSTAIATPA